MNARAIALNILNEIYQEKAYANISLSRHLTKNSLSDQDRRFITELVYGTVKAGDTLLWILKKFINRPLGKIEPVIVNILRLGIYQIVFMDKIPSSAACNEAVNLAKKFSNPGSAKFVNGILRNLIRQPEKYTMPTGNKAAEISVREQHPLWLVKKFIHTFGSEAALALCRFNNTNAPLVLRTNTLKITRKELINELNDSGCEVNSSDLTPEGIVCSKHPALNTLKPLQNGLAQVQDESSMLVAHVLDPKPGDFIIDTCSAPGGKTTHIAALMNNTGTVIAGDIYEHKLKIINENAARLGIDIIETQLLDARQIGDLYPQKADKILVDAPCSGLGVLRRKPDSRWNKTEELLYELPPLQLEILHSAAKAVKIGGVLVYSTCTIMPEENQNVIDAFLAAQPNFVLDDVHKYLPFKHKSKNRTLQLMPHVDHTDGFFIARLIRKS